MDGGNAKSVSAVKTVEAESPIDFGEGGEVGLNGELPAEHLRTMPTTTP